MRATSRVPASRDRLNRLLGFIGRDPGNMTLRGDVIREACDRQQWPIALDLVESGLRERPQDTRLLLPVRARCLHHLGRLNEAIDDCDILLATAPEGPDSTQTHGLLALLLYDKGRWDDAGTHATMALQYEPRQLEALLVRACLYCDAGKHEYTRAQECFRTLLEHHPDCGRAWLRLALLEFSQLRFDSARRHIERATRYIPGHIGTWHVLAWIHLLQQEVSAAKAAFQQSLALNRNFAETHGGLAVVAALQGHDIEARASIKRALRLDQRSLAARFAQLLLLKREGRETEADALLRSVVVNHGQISISSLEVPAPRVDTPTGRDPPHVEPRHEQQGHRRSPRHQ